MEDEAGDKRPGEIHGEAADEIFEEALADVVGYDHHGKKRDERREDQAVDEDDHARFFEVGQLWAFDFAIDLGEGFFAAHGEDGVAERDEDRDDTEHVRQAGMGQPAERARGEMNVAGNWKWG